MASLNHQILHTAYEFKEGAPLKEYLRRKVSIFREQHTLYDFLTMLMIIIPNNNLLDEINPAII